MMDREKSKTLNSLNTCDIKRYPREYAIKRRLRKDALQ